MKIANRLDSGNQLHHYLIERSLTGDRKAQNELYNLYCNAMYNICRRMLGNEDDAKDALQDSFIHAFSKLPRLNDFSLFGGWLKRIVLNNCIDTLRKRREFDNIQTTPEAVEEDETPADEWKEFTIDKIMKAMDGVSDGCKTVLNLYVFEGYDHTEIAQILSISEVTSRSQYAKAKKKIKHILTTEK